MTPALHETAGGLPTTLERDEMAKRSLEDRFWEKVDRHGPIPDYAPHLGPCWEWTGTIHQTGYGTLAHRRAHRLSYELLIGPIPEGLVIDHLCRVKHCVNPAHLEPVTQAENVRRGIAPTATNARKTHCKHGHEFTPENTYWMTGGPWRECRTCKRRMSNIARNRRRAEDYAMDRADAILAALADAGFTVARLERVDPRYGAALESFDVFRLLSDPTEEPEA